MHSMKNTLIAVGLLGLSFWFYNESQKKGPDLSHEIPALDISDGAEKVQQFASNAADSVQSKLGGLKDLELPDFSKQKQAVSDFASNVGDEFNQKANQLKSQANQLKDQVTGQLKSQANDFANDFANNFDSGKMPTLEAPQSSERSGLPVANRQTLPNTLDSAARDAGLINALEEQNNWQNKPAAPNNFSANPNEFSFTSQPGSASDSSYNKLATDINNGGSDGSNISLAGGTSIAAKLPIQSAWPEVDRLVEAKKFKAALQLLTQYYRDPNLPGPHRQRLMAWLDALAGKVIFSTEDHLHSMPYTVGNESLADISQRWNVPAQLIYNINQKRIPNPANLMAGTQLKMLEGPFHSEVDVSEKVMTLFLGDLYAGRFPIEMGISGNPQPGEYHVMFKSAEGQTWLDENGKQYPPSSPMNGYGPHWLGLTNQLCIHQISESTPTGHNGCIGVKGEGAKDVFAILHKNSRVKVFR